MEALKIRVLSVTRVTLNTLKKGNFMKKIVLISSLAITLFSSDVKFNLVDKNPSHVIPTNNKQVLSYNSAIKEAIKSVVNISTKTNVKITKNFAVPDLPFPREFMEPLFKSLPHSKALKALGSGVILTSDGYIVTNSHVVHGADEIKVTLPHSKKEYKAKIVGIDSDSDLAVIKIEANNLTPIKIANSKDSLVGDVVFAIGNPFGVGETVTSGIISALNKNRVGLNQYENFIQTDASINPGNSGGALVDSRGALIGINSAIISKSGGNNGIGLAIPSNMVVNITKKLIEKGRVDRGYIGISISDVTKNLASIYNHKNGAVVVDIEKNSPAYKYGLKRGDLIYEINGKPIMDAPTLKTTIGSLSPKSKVVMKVERNKKDITIDAILANKSRRLTCTLNQNLDGLSLSSLTNELRYQYRIPREVNGILITDIKPNSKAEEVGLQVGDVIIQIEDRKIKCIEDIEDIFSTYKDIPKRVYVNRYGEILMFVIK